MYYLYLDESGDDGDYLDLHGNIIPGSSRFLVVGGIFVEDSKISDFDQKFSQIINKYFISKGITLPSNFKLHYTTLKRGIKPPYDQITTQERLDLADEIFDAVNTIDCSLFAASLDIQDHCIKYNDRVNAKAYMLFLIYEKLDRIKKQSGISAEIVYEEFNQIRKKIKLEIDKLLSFPTFPNPQNLIDIEKFVRSGKPNQHPVLQFADFIANATWFHRTKPNQANDKFIVFRERFFGDFNGITFQNYMKL